MSAAVLACSASSPGLGEDLDPLSSGRPIQRLRGGLTSIFEVIDSPGGISIVGGVNL